MYFAECQLVDTRQSRQLGDTRQRRLCRVPAIWHSAKRILKLKKTLCRVPDHGHSAKHAYIPNGQRLLPHSLTLLTHTRRRRALAHRAPAHRRRDPAREDLAHAAPPCPPYPRPPCPCRRRAPRPPRPRPRRRARSRAVVPLTHARHACCARAAVPLAVPLARPRRAPRPRPSPCPRPPPPPCPRPPDASPATKPPR
jgi:hypothetical protein